MEEVLPFKSFNVVVKRKRYFLIDSENGATLGEKVSNYDNLTMAVIGSH